jgi:hypothetical protein
MAHHGKCRRKRFKPALRKCHAEMKHLGDLRAYCGAAPIRGVASRSLASDRSLVELSKTLDFNTIAKKFGRTPASILKTATHLGIAIKRPRASTK